MKSIKGFIVPMIMFLSSGYYAFAQQTIQFSYDPSGNRTERHMVLLPLEPSNEENPSEETEYEYEEQEEAYTDVLNNHEITVFPNPSGGQFDVKITSLGEVKEAVITLFSITGEPLLFRKNPDGTEHFDIRHLGNGTYTLMIQLDDRQSVWKIIKQ